MEQKNESVINEILNTERSGIDIMPDSAISVSERNAYGYDWDGMLPLYETRALELFDQNRQVYLLYSDGTESAVDFREEITEHTGIFGIDTDDWTASQEYAEMVKASLDKEASQETSQENETGAERPHSQSYDELLREHIKNQALYGYLSETDVKILNDNIGTLEKKMVDTESKYENGMPLDVETDTIDRLFQETLAMARKEQQRPLTVSNTERQPPNPQDSRAKPSILAQVEENKKLIAGKEPQNNAPKRGHNKEV